VGGRGDSSRGDGRSVGGSPEMITSKLAE
jgi:hypothetical protein